MHEEAFADAVVRVVLAVGVATKPFKVSLRTKLKITY